MKKTVWLLVILVAAIIFMSCSLIEQEPKTYMVIYNGNGYTGGNVPADNNSYENGMTVIVMANNGNIVKTGYSFAGWNTQTDGKGTDRIPGSTFTMGSANITLYAKWTINQYTVIYNGNGSTEGTVPATTNYDYNTLITASDNTGNLVKMQDGISLLFVGWNTSANGSGTEYAVGDSFEMGNANVTLFAQWSVLRGTGPAGGLIFYDKGSYSYGWRYLEAAPSDQSTGMRWYDGTWTYIDAPGIAPYTCIGCGRSNTTAIVVYQGSGTYAAKLCDDLVLNGYNDWFLPSIEELFQIYQNLKLAGVGDLNKHFYWSSTDTNCIHNAHFGQMGGDVNNFYRTDLGRDREFAVRAVRAF